MLSWALFVLLCISLQVEEKLKELERLQYVNPDISLEEKEKGNAYFKAGIYGGCDWLMGIVLLNDS